MVFFGPYSKTSHGVSYLTTIKSYVKRSLWFVLLGGKKYNGPRSPILNALFRSIAVKRTS